MRYSLIIAVVLFFTGISAAQTHYKKIAFYIVAHQDDWQLFMGNEVFRDVNDPNTKVVIIHTTAGDGGRGNKAAFKAREKGAVNALKFCLSQNALRQKEKFDTVSVAGHLIRRYANKNVENYFLMLPDGCNRAGWHGLSMEYLERRKIHLITTIDSSAIYYGWQDLVGTIRKIIEADKEGIRHVSMHVSDIDKEHNPNDHRDHIYTSLAALQAAKNMGQVSYFFYVGYHARDLKPNLRNNMIAQKGALYALTDFGITEEGSATTWPNHQEFVDRCYFRETDRKPNGVIDSFLRSKAVK